MLTGVASRMAGKALLDFFKEGSKAVSSYARDKALTSLTRNLGDYADAPGLLGRIASKPEGIASFVGMAAPVALAGTTAGALSLGGKLLGGGDSENREGSRVSFANQQYMPGMSPMTNQAVASSVLAEQRFNQQMQLLQARQNALSGRGSLQSSNATGGTMDILSKIYA